MVIVGIVIVILHGIVIGTIILWYEKGSPTSMERFRVDSEPVSGAGGWHNPITSDQEDFRLVAKAA